MELKWSKARVIGVLFAMTLGAGSIAHAWAASNTTPADSRIHVSWVDPSDMTEVKQNANRWKDKPSHWLGELQKHLVRRATARLPSDERLDVKFTDVQLAGNYEPWRGPSFDRIRVVKDIYPPRINLSFTLSDANGSVIASGERKLRDMAFLSRASINDSDTLRYEKRLLDDWLTREFGTRAVTDAR